MKIVMTIEYNKASVSNGVWNQLISIVSSTCAILRYIADRVDYEIRP